MVSLEDVLLSLLTMERFDSGKGDSGTTVSPLKEIGKKGSLRSTLLENIENIYVQELVDVSGGFSH